MINFDMHVHTEYCGHAPGMTVQAILKRADDLGLEALAITEHIFSSSNLSLLDEIRDQLAEYRGNCEVLVGVEVDVDGMSREGKLVTENLDGIDFVVGSIHYVPGVGNYPMTPGDLTVSPEQFLEDWRNSLRGLLTCGKIDMLAHPGRIAVAALDADIYFGDIVSILSEAAKISADNNIAWEINELSCKRLKPRLLKKWHKIIIPAVEAGVKITFGSDAHDQFEIANQENVRQVIADLGDDFRLCGPMELGLL